MSVSRGKPLDPGHIGILDEELPPFESGFIDFAQWFAPELRGNPLEIEIGSGKGTFLVSQAAANAGVNYLGLEWARSIWRYAADRVRRHGLENVRLIRADAEAFVRNFVADASVQQVHIYFPDPWPKARHNKRRLVQASFLRQLHRILQSPPEGDLTSGVGCVRLATDHTDYFEWMVDHASQVTDLFDRLEFVRPDSAEEGELVGTNFERKYRREGRPFHSMTLRKRG